MADLVVLGAHGQLGRALLRLSEERGTRAVGSDLDTLDITDASAVASFVAAARPRTVVNCAAFTAVDACEEREEEATKVNGTAVGHLARACNSTSSLLVQVSTDYVFPGTATEPYRESDPVGPLSAYGRSKLRGEVEARLARRHLIVRTAWLYGRDAVNFVEAIRRQVDGGATTLRVVADQVGSPTFCDDLAAAILDLVKVGAEGVVHAVNAGVTSWHGFASEIVRQLGARVEVTAVSTAEYPRPARRPPYSVLDTSHLEALLGRPLPPWQDALARYLGAR